MSNKEYIPRFFLICGSIFIFISIFLEWETITDLMTGDTTISYGYDRPSIIILFFVSLFPIILYERGIIVAKYYMLVILVEIILFTFSLQAHPAMYVVETRVGYYFTLIGGFFQLIGMLTIFIIEKVKRKNVPTTDRSEHIGKHPKEFDNQEGKRIGSQRAKDGVAKSLSIKENNGFKDGA